MVQFNQLTFDIICEQLADGESLRTICAREGMPSKANVFRWLSANQDAADQYARAREAQADSLVDDILLIADDTSREPNDRRVAVDARKWVASKLRPKAYGDKLDLNGNVGFSVTISRDDADL